MCPFSKEKVDFPYPQHLPLLSVRDLWARFLVTIPVEANQYLVLIFLGHQLWCSPHASVIFVVVSIHNLYQEVELVPSLVRGYRGPGAGLECPVEALHHRRFVFTVPYQMLHQFALQECLHLLVNLFIDRGFLESCGFHGVCLSKELL